MTHPMSPVPAMTVLPPSPLTVGQAMSSTFDILKRRFGLFLALAFLPGVAIAVLVIIAAVIVAAAMIGAFAGATRSGVTGNVTGAVILSIVVLLVVMFAAMAITVKTNGMITLLAHETALGRTPQLPDLNAGTRGIVGRTLLLILVALVASGVVMGIFFGVMAATFAAAMTSSSSSSGSSNAAGGVLVLLGLLVPVFYIAAIYLGTRWIYLNQGLAIEGKDGFAALGNSWNLTRKDFWRTLGWYLLAMVGIWLVMFVLSMVSGGLLAPAMTSMQRGNSPMQGAAAGALIVYSLLWTVIEALLVPTIAIYVTVMYIDQKRRNELTAAGVPLNWTPQQYQTPGYPAGQPQQFGAPGSPYGPAAGQQGVGPSNPSGQPGMPAYGPPAGQQYGAPTGTPQYGYPSAGGPSYGAPGQSASQPWQPPAQAGWQPPTQQPQQPPTQAPYQPPAPPAQ